MLKGQMLPTTFFLDWMNQLCELPAGAVRRFRVCLSLMIFFTAFERWPVLRVFYTDDGTLSVSRLRSMTGGPDTWHNKICIHGWSGLLIWQQFLTVVQCLLAFFLLCHSQRWMRCLRILDPRGLAAASLLLYISATLRNIQLAYILDRYMHVLLLAAACLPLDDSSECVNRSGKKDNARVPVVRSLACLLYRLELAWIYLDAGQAKLFAEDGGWMSSLWKAGDNDPSDNGANEAPLPALDSYLRHTPFATWYVTIEGGPSPILY